MNASATFHSVLTMIASALVMALSGYAADPSGSGNIRTSTTAFPLISFY